MRLGRRREPAYSIFFATDLHGSEKCFGKFLNAARFYGVDALVLGGDLTGKVMVPIVRRDDGGHEAEFLDTRAVARTEDELLELEKRIRFNGQYPHRCDEGELERLREDRVYRERVFDDVIRADVERWVARAEERLNGTPCIAIPGNDDAEFVGDVLSTGERLVNAEGRIVELGPFQVLSLGYSNPTPWHSPRELEEDELEDRLDALARELEPERPAVFNLHAPPYNSGLDLAPEIDDDFNLVGGATSRFVPVGSRAVAAVIERVQPLLTLHGHVHESRACTTIGRTVCVNPGSEYNVGVLRGAIVRLTDEKVLGHQFVAG